jgi:hypothetical protein
MTNIFNTPKKRERKKRLFEIGVETLEGQGWTVTKEKLGKSSVRRISKEGQSLLVSIRTTQDTWIAFPPKPAREGWVTLDDVEVVIAVSVDDAAQPREARVHWIPADDLRKRFSAALEARTAADRVQPDRRGVWIPLYEREADNVENVSYVGGGAGLDYPPIARVPMIGVSPPLIGESVFDGDQVNVADLLSIAEAKRRLARTLGVPESSITIMVEA